MSAISKLTAAFASATNEFTLAAANFSMDFSLMKVEAPIEFHGLGRGLSERRRMEAESGPPHITARKLGALFNDIAPPTPELVKAYGRRVSEIADTPEVNPRGQGTMVFGNHVGADGTSIWAAATSGSGALQIQLLTCMLARVWDGPEAISVWVELVKERKEDIAKQCEDGHAVPYGAVMATRQEISRDQLAEWDASARAWLRTADQAKLLQQKQLMLVIDNVEVPVNHDMRVYSSVIAAWKTALQALENLVVGMPQSLHQEGSILLALSAWHLYPDLLILKDSIKRVQFKDTLIASSGTLTLGMFKDGDKGLQGVYWSLSLAHLRYYGDPIVRTQAITRESSRITFLQLMQVALGSLSAAWSKTYLPVNALELAALFASLGALFENVKADDQLLRAESVRETLPDWLHMLVKASRSAVEAKGREYEVVVKLLNVGQRHGSEFLVTEQDSVYIDPCFGLLDLEKLLPMLKEPEQRIWLLRQIAEKLRLDSHQIIIRYFVYPKIDEEIDEKGLPEDHPGRYDTPIGDGSNDNMDEDENSDLEADSDEDMQTDDGSVQSSGGDENSDLEADSDDMQTDNGSVQSSGGDAVFRNDDRTTPSHIEYATAIPRTEQTSGQQYPVSENVRLVHKRWVTREFVDAHQELRADSTLTCDCIGHCRKDYCACYRRNLRCTTECQPSLTSERRPKCDNTEASRLYSARMEAIRNGGEEIILRGNDPLDTQTVGSHRVSANILDPVFASGALQATENSWDQYEYLFGDNKTAAIYVLRGSPTQKAWEETKNTTNVKPVVVADLKQLTFLVNTGGFKMKNLLSCFRTPGIKLTAKPQLLASGEVFNPSIAMSWKNEDSLKRFYSSLKALAAASKVYEPFPDTTIAIGIIRKPVNKRHWASAIPEPPETLQFSPDITRAPLGNVLAPLTGTQSGGLPANMLSRAATFSCLTLFESGHCDVNPSLLKDVMALSSGDSIYVAAPLLCDPLETKRPHEMRRVIGNIGRPGITMLVPPANPLIRQVGPENWNVVTYAGYDGKREDSFQGTTLHLSFTGYNPAIVLGDHGAQDAEVFVLESVVSVHDHGKWVADLDVLKALGSRTLARISGTSEEICPHKTDELPSTALTAIDSWEEFLDLPSKPSVVRARGNWVARLSLAVAGIGLRSGTKAGQILLCGDTFCWKCYEDSDNDEKNQQVALMRQIYAKSFLVVSWLGCTDHYNGVLTALNDIGEKIISDAKNGVDLNTDWLKSFASMFEQTPIRYPSAPSDTRFQTGLQEPNNNPYWTRLWITQEITVASQVAFMCGQQKLPAFRLRAWLHWLDASAKRALPQPAEIVDFVWNWILNHAYQSIWNLVRVLRLSSTFCKPLVPSDEEPLWCEPIEQNRWLKCSDQRDRIYGLTGLCKGYSLAIDYNKSVREVYIDFVRESLLGSCADRIFDNTSPEHGMNVENPHKLPSWVPDWNRMDDRRWDLPRATERGAGRERGRGTVMMSILTTDCVVKIRGIRADRVRSVHRISTRDEARDFFKAFLSAGGEENAALKPSSPMSSRTRTLWELLNVGLHMAYRSGEDDPEFRSFISFLSFMAQALTQDEDDGGISIVGIGDTSSSASESPIQQNSPPRFALEGKNGITYVESVADYLGLRSDNEFERDVRDKILKREDQPTRYDNSLPSDLCLGPMARLLGHEDDTAGIVRLSMDMLRGPTAIKELIKCRSFFQSEKGCLGLASHGVRIDDEIVVFPNFSFCHLLRRVDGNYRLMGPGYVAGIMEGQLMEALSNGSTELETFEIF